MLPEGVARHWKMKLCLGFQISLMSFPIQLMRQHFNPNLVFDLQERKLNNQCLVFTQKGGKIAVKPVELMPHQFAGDYSYSPASCKNKEQIESKKETL